MKTARLSVLATLLLTGTCWGQNREEKVRGDKETHEAKGYWIYNDMPKAFASAKASGKPIIAVLRCIPCEECVKLDDDLIDADPAIKKLLDQFERVRIVSTNGLDLNLFQFDTDQSFAVFFFNADGTLYGRFGTRSHRKNWVGDVSVEGLAKAMEGALEIHKNYPVLTRKSVENKQGKKPGFARPELMPGLKEKYKSTLDYAGKLVQSCIHCHQIGDAMREEALSKGKLPDQLLFPYPHPKSLGLILDPKERATVLDVMPGSDAAKAGLIKGDVITSINNSALLLSIADVQWVLHNTPPDGGSLSLTVLRKGANTAITLDLPKGWKDRDDISWRASTWGLRRKAFGGMKLGELPPEDRTKWKLPEDKTALLVEHVGQYAPHNVAQVAGVRKGDILLSFDGKTTLLRETDLIAHSLRNKKPGDAVELILLRDGAKKTVTLKLP